MNNNILKNTLIITGIILLAAFSRLIPHMHNFAPMGAIALFGGAYLNRTWIAMVISLGAIWVSDLILNNTVYAGHYASFTWLYEGWMWNFAAYAAIIFIGAVIFKKVTPFRIGTGALISTGIFFALSNFGTWMVSGMYPKNPAGLAACYAAGIPFLSGTMLSDLVFSTSMFGVVALYQYLAAKPAALKPAL